MPTALSITGYRPAHVEFVSFVAGPKPRSYGAGIHRTMATKAVATPTRDPNGKDVSFTMVCNFEINDPDEYLWDFTYEARMYDPSMNQIKYGSNWVSDKSGYASFVDKTMTDPAEGTYTCTVDWWVYSYHLGQQQQARGLSYSSPTGEISVNIGWGTGDYATAGLFTGALANSGFAGRRVTEATDYSNTDGCKAAAGGGGPVPVFNTVSGFTWTIDAYDSYGPDGIGWPTAAVAWYRANVSMPCETNFGQAMYINKPGNSNQQYATNALRVQIAASTVTSQRGNSSATKSY